MTLEDLDRTIFEHIRVEVVRLGLLPDILLHPDPVTGPVTYRNAIESLQQTLKYKQIVDVLGVGAENARDEKRPNRIVVDRTTIFQGTLGSYGVTDFEENTATDDFTKSKREFSTQNVQYNIRCISNSAHYDRILNQIIIKVFNRVNYKKLFVNSAFTEDEILITQTDSRDVSSTDLLEKLFTYTVEDVYIGEDEILDTSIKKLIEVDGSMDARIDIDGVTEIDGDPQVQVGG